MKKFQTISLTNKIHRSNLSTTANKFTERKSNSVLANPENNLGAALSVSVLDNDLTLPKIKAKKRGSFL